MSSSYDDNYTTTTTTNKKKNGCGSFLYTVGSKIAGPIGMRIFITILLSTMATFLWSGRDYYKYYQLRAGEHSKMNNFYTLNCIDARIASKTGATAQCERIEYDKDWWPSISALFDVIEDWLPCGKLGCFYYIHEWTNSSVLKIILFVIVIYILAMAIWGVNIFTHRKREQTLRFSLPSNGLNTEPLIKHKGE